MERSLERELTLHQVWRQAQEMPHDVLADQFAKLLGCYLDQAALMDVVMEQVKQAQEILDQVGGAGCQP